MRILNFAKIIVVIVVFVGCFYYGQNVSYEIQNTLYEGLRNTSAVIFGIMGIWIAVIYPDVLSNIFKKKERGEIELELRKVNRLLYPLLYSTLALIVVLIVTTLAPLLKLIPFFIKNYMLLRGISYSILGVLTLLQIWALILALIPGDVLNRGLARYLNKVKIADKLHSRNQRR